MEKLKTKIPKDTYTEIASRMPILTIDGILFHNGRLLLLERKNEPLRGHYWLPGGRVYKNESIKEAFKRKMKEETGLDVFNIKLLGYYEDMYKKSDLDIDLKHTVSIVFKADVKSKEVKLDDQSTNYKWTYKLPDKLEICYN